MKTKHRRIGHSYRLDAVMLIVVLVALLILLPRFASISESLSTFMNADHAYIWLSILASTSTFFSAAAVYKFIALRPLKYRATLLVQLASGFTNRLVPLGAGIVALNVDYLIKHKHTAAQAGAVVALNNLLGFVSMAILLVGCFAFSQETLDFQIQVSPVWVIIVASLLIIGLIAALIFGAKVLRQIQSAIQMVVIATFKKPLRLLVALLASTLITIGYAATLYIIGLAFNVHLSIVQSLWVLTLGVVSASVTPTPGGIGGAEVGLIAALSVIGVSAHQAVIIALTYRFVTYWLPIAPGLVCFQIALRKRYI